MPKLYKTNKTGWTLTAVINETIRLVYINLVNLKYLITCERLSVITVTSLLCDASAKWFRRRPDLHTWIFSTRWNLQELARKLRKTFRNADVGYVYLILVYAATKLFFKHVADIIQVIKKCLTHRQVLHKQLPSIFSGIK